MKNAKPFTKIVVTGASRGIGMACANYLAERGYSVLAGVRTQKAIDEINASKTLGIEPVILDVTNEDCLRKFADSSKAQDVGALINNAGTAVLGPIECLAIDDIRQQFEVNLFGTIRLTQLLLPAIRRARGRIINVSSISGVVAFPYFGAYASSKFALEGFSNALRREVRPFGVNVSIIQPGNIDTGIWKDSFTRGKNMEDSYSKELVKLYGKRFFRSEKGYGPAVKSSPLLVSEAIFRALTDATPKQRYIVGRDAKHYRRLKRFLPANLFERIF